MPSEETARPQRRRGSKAYLGAAFAAQFCALARYTLLARLIGPEELGIAVPIILTAQFFESVTDSGSDRFLIQDKAGNAPEVQRLAHLVWVARGLFIAVALVLLAQPVAVFYGAPELRNGLLLLALAPLIAGLVHLDYRRVQRNNDFRGESRVLVASESASLLVTAIAAWLTRDHTAILYGLITRSIVMVLVSQLAAERRYSLGYAREHAGRLAAFAVPLMLNGLLLFLGSQGDRVLVGRVIGLTELGFYSAAILLIFYPSGMVQRYMSGIHLPLVAGAIGDPAARRRAEDRLGGQTLILSVAMAAGYALVAPYLIILLYGQAFELPVLLVAAIGVLQCARTIRLWPVTVALAHGNSRIVLVSNLLRLLGFPLAFLGVDLLGGLLGVIAAFAVAELLSLPLTLLLLSRHIGERRRYGQGRLLLFAGICLAILVWAAIASAPTLPLVIAAGAASLFLIFALLRSEAATFREVAAFLKRNKRVV